MHKNKAALRIEGKGEKTFQGDQDENDSDSATEDEIMRSYEQYRKELQQELQTRKLLSDELDDVAGKP